MTRRILLTALAAATIALTSAPADARQVRHKTAGQPQISRSAIDVAAIPPYPLENQVKTPRRQAAAANRKAARVGGDRQSREGREASPEASYGEMAMLAHPAGCPVRQFCACGAAVEIFGEPKRELWPVSAWYAFPRTSPGAGMVAIMHAHHLVVLHHQVSGSEWVVNDYNSGGHLSRRQIVNIARATIVNPHGAMATYSARKHRVAHHHKRIRLAHR